MTDSGPPITSSRDLLSRGHSYDELCRMTRRGELVRVRRGVYAASASEPLDARGRHLRLIRATLPDVSNEAVVSHASAAVVHGLPVWDSQLDFVQLTRDRASGGKIRGHVHVHAQRLDAEDIVVMDGIAVTSLARTVLDLACVLPLERSVAVGDVALRMGLEEDRLAQVVGAAAGRRGVGLARLAATLLDGRSESPQESRSRVIFHLQGVPKPELQWVVRDADGKFIARTDFGWPELRTVGEFDGEVKYGRLLRPGEDPGAVVFKEKIREDAIRDESLQVVRWVAAELNRPAALVERLNRAFDRGRRSA